MLYYPGPLIEWYHSHSSEGRPYLLNSALWDQGGNRITPQVYGGVAALTISELPSEPFFLPWKIVHSCIQIVLWPSSVKSRKFNSPPSSHPTFFVFLSSNQQCICWHKSVSIPRFCWDDWLNPWATTIVSLSSDCLTTSLVFSSEQAFSFFV